MQTTTFIIGEVYQTMTDSKANALEELSFDPWGRRRNPKDWSFTDVPTSFLFDRGYTGHSLSREERNGKHLDKFGLINMPARQQRSTGGNGRVYDPFVARFLSPDPYIQAPGYTQSYNRYSYCVNNPLKFTDPSGYGYKPDDWAGGSSSYYSFFGAGYKGGMTPLSGNNWVNQIWSESENFERTSRMGFDNHYGEGSWNIGNQLNSNPSTRQDWQSGKISLDIVRRNGGFWVDSNSTNTLTLTADPVYGGFTYSEGIEISSKWVSFGFTLGGGIGQGDSYLTSDFVGVSFDKGANNSIYPKLASYFSNIMQQASQQGIYSVNISTTTNHPSNPKSAHQAKNGARAFDMNYINGIHVSTNNPYVSIMQTIIQNTSGWRENYGPLIIQKMNNGVAIPAPWARDIPGGHYDHIHISVPW